MRNGKGQLGERHGEPFPIALVSYQTLESDCENQVYMTLVVVYYLVWATIC